MNYPKKPRSPYLMFVQEERNRSFPDDNYLAPVKSSLHSAIIREYVIKWRSLTNEGKARFKQASIDDQNRYLIELEQWKLKMAKLENTANLKQLDRLSKLLERAREDEQAVRLKIKAIQERKQKENKSNNI